MGVQVKIEGPVEKSEVVSEDGEDRCITSVDTRATASAMAMYEDVELADLLLNEDAQQLYNEILNHDNDYYMVDEEDWSVRLTGKNESRPLVVAADAAETNNQFEYETALHALIAWSHDEEFLFQQKAGWLAEKAAENQRWSNLTEWYDDHLKY